MVCFGFNRTPVLALQVDEVSALEGTRRNYKIYPTNSKPLKELLDV